MKITKVSVHPGAAASSPGNYLLTEFNSDSGLYQQLLHFRLTKPDTAEFLRLNAAETGLNVTFSDYSYNAVGHSNSALKAKVSNRQQMVLVEFQQPVYLTAIDLLKSHASASYRILVHRLDGDTIAEQASTIAVVGKVRDKFGSQESVLALRDLSDKVSKNGGQKRASGEIKLVAEDKKAEDFAYQALNQSFFCDIRGDRFALELVDSNSQRIIAFDSTWLSALQIVSMSSTPQVSLVPPMFDKSSGQFGYQGSSPLLLRVFPGELGGEDTPNPGMVSLTEVLRSTLTNALVALEPVFKANAGQHQLDFKLVISSAAPCRVQLSGFGVGYTAVKLCLLDQHLAKTSLKFDGQVQTSHKLSLSVPAATNIRQAVLVTDLSYNKTAGNAATLSPADLNSQMSATVANQGLTALAGHSLLQAVRLQTAVIARAIHLALTVLEEHTRITLSLVKDRGNGPAGEVLLTIDVSDLTPALVQWKAVPIPQKTVVDSGLYWLKIDVHQGQLIWHLQTAATDFAQRLNAQSMYHAMQGYSGVYLLEQESAYDEANLAIAARQKLNITLDGIRLPLLPQESKDTDSIGRYDMSNALANKQGTLTLAFSTSQRGMMTVYAPEIEFDV